MKSRLPIVLALAVLLVGVLVYVFVFDDGSDRSGRQAGIRDGGAGDAALAEEADETTAGGIATEAMLAELIGEYGGFTTKLAAVLTRPEGPGAGLDVRLRGQVAGAIVEVDGQTDPSGHITLPALPRTGRYELTIEGPRAQTHRQDGIAAPDGPELDLGEIRVDRWYVVRGKVYGNGRAGVAGAEVALLPEAFTTGGGFSFYKFVAEAGEAEPILAEVESSADGAYEIKLSRPGTFTLRARAEGWAPHTKGDVVVGGIADAVHDLALSEGATVIGFVLDGAGRPLAETPVTLTPGGRRAWTGGWFKEVAETDGAGRFEFHVEPGRYNATVVAEAGLNLTKEFEAPLTEDLVLRMPGLGVLTGRVVDATTQQPVGDAEILLGLTAGGGRGMRPDHSKALRTDPYGRFRVEGVGRSRIQSVSVRADGYEDLRAMAWMGNAQALYRELQKMEIDGTGEHQLPDLPLDRGRALTGVVTDRSNGRPLAGARVEMQDFIMGARATTTDAAGRYRFEGVGDRVAMFVTADGYAPLRDSPMPGVALSGEGDAQRDVALDPGGVVRGRVATADGTPVVRALVRLRPAATGWRAMGVAMSLRNAWTHTDENGEYLLSGVAIAKLYAEARAPGFDASRSKEVDVKAGATAGKVDVTLLPGATMEGVVVARDGTPVAGARLTIAADPGENADQGAQWRALGAGTYAFTDARGRFSLREVPLGDVMLRAEADGFATVTVRRRGVAPGQSLDNVRLEMPPAFTIAGVVVDENGRPYNRCWVRARHTASPDGEPMRQLLGTRVEGDGRFEIRNLPAGTYTLEVTVFNWGRTEGNTRYENLVVEAVGSGAKDLVLRLRPAE